MRFAVFLLLCMAQIVICNIDFCYNELCDIHTGYYIRSSNKTLIFVEDMSDDTQLCVSIAGNAVIYCEMLVSGWMYLPVHLSGRNSLSFAVQVHQHLSLTYYIYEVENAPSTMAYVDLTSPSYGTIKTDRLLVHFRANSIALTQAQALDLDILEVKHVSFLPTFSHIDTLGHDAIEPGSYFYRMSAVTPDSSIGFANHGYIEFVLSSNEIARQRRFAADYSLTPPNHQKQKTPNHSRICIWGSDSLDGQKNIWLQQMRFMSKEEFSFTYVLTNVARKRHRNKYEAHINNSVPLDVDGEFVVTATGMAHQLRSLEHVKMVVSPFEKNAVQINDLDEVPGDGSPALSAVWDNTEDVFLKYVLQRFQAADGVIDKITPVWCRNVFISARQHLIEEQCDIVVYGNNRGFSSDFILVSLARTLGIPTVTELLNLFVDSASIPDIIIAPSHYALEHTSVQEAIGSGALGVVIQPGVDMAKFNSASRTPLPQHMHSCRNGQSKGGCIVIGFVGRLAIEKNPGLFLLTAHTLLQRCPFCRFVIIGDGALRSELTVLAEQLGINWAVEFRGWVGSDLPEVLGEVDVLVNPSLRAWSETFCIANVEAMALGIPLVTFGVGGVGEYVIKPSGNEVNYTCISDDGVSEPCTPFHIADNAVVVNIPVPAVVAAAVEVLIQDQSLRLRLGSAGKELVEQYFNTTRQMAQYAEVYRTLVSNDMKSF